MLPPTLNQSIPRKDIHGDFDKGFRDRHEDASEDRGHDAGDHELGNFCHAVAVESVNAIVVGILLDWDAVYVECKEEEAP